MDRRLEAYQELNEFLSNYSFSSDAPPPTLGIVAEDIITPKPMSLQDYFIRFLRIKNKNSIFITETVNEASSNFLDF